MSEISAHKKSAPRGSNTEDGTGTYGRTIVPKQGRFVNPLAHICHHCPLRYVGCRKICTVWCLYSVIKKAEYAQRLAKADYKAYVGKIVEKKRKESNRKYGNGENL